MATTDSILDQSVSGGRVTGEQSAMKSLSKSLTKPVDLTVDIILVTLGPYGSYQLLGWLLLILFEVVCSWHLVNPFLAAEPDHMCYIPPSPWTDNLSIGQKIPIVYHIRGYYTYHPCRQYKQPQTPEELEQVITMGTCEPWRNITRNCFNNRSTIPCQNKWVYANEFGLTLINEWELVCDRAYRGDLLVMAFYLGDLVGAIFIPVLADIYGRKKIFILSTWLVLPFGILAVMVRDSPLRYALLKFWSGVFLSGAYCVCSILICELFPKGHRSIPQAGEWMSNSVGMMSLAVLAYFFRNWTNIQFFITAPLFFISIFSIFFLPESLQYLIATNQIAAARKWIVKAGKWNNVVVPKHILEALDTAESAVNPETLLGQTHGSKLLEDSSNYLSMVGISRETKATGEVTERPSLRIIDLFSSNTLRKPTMLLDMLFFLTSMTYYGMALSSELLPGDRYLVFGLMGCMELPMFLITRWLSSRCGLVRICSTLYLLLISAMVATAFLPPGYYISLERTALYLTAKAMITATLGLLYLIATDTFPKDLTNAGLSSCAIGARLGGSLAPLTVTLARLTYRGQPFLYAGMGLLSTVAVLLLPTLNDKGRYTGKSRKRMEPL